jgi:hypothetical protein
MDNRIMMNYQKQIKDKGWTRQRRSAAKLPPSVLFGIHKSDSESAGTAATKFGFPDNTYRR